MNDALQSNLAIPDFDNTDASLSLMKCCGFKKISQQNLTCCPGSLVVPDRFFGFWPSGIARCDCSPGERGGLRTGCRWRECRTTLCHRADI